ncbi:MAG: protease complex subunit PrcB family protein [Gemmatimonadetes bacterium]|nr:protease complex subunit PrcB family protein [Gemmatimonadota bacterium]
MRFIRSFAPLLIAAVPAACATAEERADVPPGETRPAGDRVPADADMLPIETLYDGVDSGIEDSRRVTIRSDSAWGAFWSELHRGQGSLEPAPPEVDFDRSVVVAATAGQKPTGGHAIDIEGVLANGDGVWVSVRKTTPGEGCVVTQALTAPAVVVKAPKRDGPVKFIDHSRTRDC